MSTILVSRTMSHPPELVWQKLADFGGIHKYSAGVASSPVNPGTPATGVGSERLCTMYDGNHIEERITELVDGELLALEIVKTSMPLAHGGARFTLVPTPTGGSELTMEMRYQLKYGPLGWLLDVSMMRRMMTGSLQRLLEALDAHLSTGEDIDQDWKPAAPRARNVA